MLSFVETIIVVTGLSVPLMNGRIERVVDQGGETRAGDNRVASCGRKGGGSRRN